MKRHKAIQGGRPIILNDVFLYHNILFFVNFFFNMLWNKGDPSRPGVVSFKVPLVRVQAYNAPHSGNMWSTELKYCELDLWLNQQPPAEPVAYEGSYQF